MAAGESIARLAVELTVAASNFLGGMGKSSKAVQEFKEEVTKLGKKLDEPLVDRFIGSMGGLAKVLNKDVGMAVLGGIAAGITAIAGAVVAATVVTAKYGGEIGTLADRTQLSTTVLQGLRFAAGQTGTELSTLTGAASKLAKELGEGSKDTASAVNMLGLSFRDLRNASPEQQLTLVLDRLGKVQNQTDKTVIATRLLGRSGVELLPLAGQYGELIKKAEELGLIMSERDVRAAQAFGDSVGGLMQAFEGLVRQVGAAITSNESLHVLIQGVTNVLGQLSKMVLANRQGMTDLVSGGVMLVAKGLVLLIDTVQLGVDAWDALKLTWLSLVNVALQLGLGFEKANLAVLKFTGAGQDQITMSKGVIMGIEKEIAANAAAADAVVASNSKKTDVIQSLRGTLVQLEKDVSAAAGKQVEFAKATTSAIPPVRTLTEEERKAAEEAKKLAEAREKQMIADWQRDTEALAAAFKTLGPSVTDVWKAWEDLNTAVTARGGIQSLGDEQLNTLVTKLRETQVAARELGMEIPELGEALGAAWREQQTRLAGIPPKIHESKVATVDWSKALEDLSNVFNVLGIDADSALGKILGGLNAGASAIANLKKSMTAGGGFSIGNFFKGGIGNIVSNISGVLTAASAAVTVGKAIVGMFTKSPAEKAAEEAGRIVGGKVSKGMSEELVKLSKDLGVSIKTATLLSLDKLADDTKQTAHQMAGPIGDLMKGIANGSVPAKEGMESLGKMFGRVREEAQAAGTVGDQLSVSMLRQAKAAGIMTDEMKAFVSELNKMAAEGAKQIAEGMAQINPAVGGMGDQWGQDAATFFAFGFQKAIEEQGILGALDTMGESLEEFFNTMQEAGNEGAVALLAPFMALREQLGENGDLRGALTTLEGMDKVFKSMAESGDITTQGFEAFQRTIQGTFNALREGGVEGNAALQAIYPSLRDLVSASQQYGFELDANTQALVDQAKAAGFAFPTDPILQVVDLLKELVTVMGGTLPDSVRRSTTEFENFQQVASQPITVPIVYQQSTTGSAPGDVDVPGFATGGYAYGGPGGGGMLARVGEEPEAITPLDDLYGRMADIVAAKVAGSGGGGNGDVYLDGQKIGRVIQELIAAGVIDATRTSRPRRG